MGREGVMCNVASAQTLEKSLNNKTRSSHEKNVTFGHITHIGLFFINVFIACECYKYLKF